MKEFIAMGNKIEGGNTMDTSPAIDPIDILTFGLAGMLRGAGRGIVRVATTEAATTTAARQGTEIFRVFGNEAKGLGQYYTTVNPGTIANYRQVAGLFPGNSGQFVLHGTLTNAEGVMFRVAAPGPGGIGGGLSEVFVPNPQAQINILRVSGANPEF